MNEKIGPIYIKDESDNETMNTYSKSLHNIIDHEVRNIVGAAYKKTEELLKENRNKLDKVGFS